MNFWGSWQSPMVQQVSHGKTMKIRELGGVKAEYVFTQEDSRLLDAYDSQQGMAQFTKESIVMISLNIFRGIIASCRGNTRISKIFVEQFRRNISLALNEDL